MTQRFTRRNFLGASAGVFAAGALGTKAAVADTLCELPKKWDETFDAVVIGAGGAGLAASIIAREGGASVVLLEKMPFPGGNTIIAGGGLNAAIKKDYEKAGITGSPELHAR